MGTKSWLQRLTGRLSKCFLSRRFEAVDLRNRPNRFRRNTPLGLEPLEDRTLPATTLGTTALLEGPATGTDTDLVATSGAWTATSNASWLHTSSSGTDNGLATFTFDANTGAQRTGTLTIAGLTLSVTQAASTAVAANPLATLVSSGLNSPASVAVDGSGNVDIADTGHYAIKQYSPSTGQVSTIVSTTVNGNNGPFGVAADGSGNVYIADTFDNQILEYTSSNQPVTTLASGLGQTFGVAVDGSGNVYFSDHAGNGSIGELFAGGGSTTLVDNSINTNFNNPRGVAVDAAGNVYIADTNDNVIKEYSPSTGQLSTLVGGLSLPQGVAVDGSGNVFIADSGHNQILERVAATGKVNTIVSGLNNPLGVAVDASDNVYIANTNSKNILERLRTFVSTTSLSETAAAGSDQVQVLPTTQSLTGQFAPSSDQSWLTIGTISGGVLPLSFTANTGFTTRTAHVSVLGQQITVNQIQIPTLATTAVLEAPAAGTDSDMININGAWTATVSSNSPWLHTSASGTGNGPVAFSFDANTGLTRTGTLTIAGFTLTVTQAGSGYVAANPLTTLISTGLQEPDVVAADSSGNVYFADNNNALQEYNPSTGQVATLASTGNMNPDFRLVAIQGIAVDSSGNVYFDSFYGTVSEYNPSTRVVSTLASGLNHPSRLAIGGAGNLYFADANNNINELSTSTGQVITLLSGLLYPSGVAVDGAGNIYYGTYYPNSFDYVQEWNRSTGQTTTLVSTGLNLTEGGVQVAVDGAGNVYIDDTFDSVVKERLVSTGQVITLTTAVTAPYGLSVDGAGNIYIADTFDNAIKEIPRAFVNTSGPTEAGAAGKDQVQVLPSTQPLTGPFAPTSDQSWLTLGKLTTGAIPFSLITANTGYAPRTAHIAVLGQQITVTQNQETTLGTTSFSEGAAASSDTDLLNITGAWTATVSSNSPWLHTSASGTDSGTVTFTFDANTGATRTGTITITGGDGGTITVTQAGSGYVAASPLTLLAALDLNNPTGTAVDGGGNDVYFADSANNRIEQYDIGHSAITVLVASGLNDPTGVAVDTAGNVYIADTGDNAIKEWIKSSNTLVTLLSAGLSAPQGVAVDSGGANVYIADTGNGEIKDYDTSTKQTTLLAFGLNSPEGVAVDNSGNVFFSDTGNNAIKEWTSPSAPVATLVSTGLNHPEGVAVDNSGNVYFADTFNNAIKEWNSPSGPVATLASTGLNHPEGVAVVNNGSSVYFADTFNNAIDECNPPSGPVTPLVSSPASAPAETAIDSSGNVYFADAQNNSVQEWVALTGQLQALVTSGTNGVTSVLNGPRGVAVDSSGNVYIADTGDNAIKEYLASTQTVTPLVSSGLSAPTGVAVDVLGNVYIADTGDNAIKEYNVSTGQLITLVSSGLNQPTGVAVDALDNVYIADTGDSVIKERLASNGQVNPLVSTGLLQPQGVAVDGAGNVYFADAGNNTVKVYNPSTSSVIPLGSGYSHPVGVTVDPAGNVYFTATDSAGSSVGLVELPREFVQPTTLSEPSGAGSDVLPAVVPSSQPLTGAFAPSSDQPWLTIGSVANGVVDFSFTANPGLGPRTAHITVLGQQLTVTQAQVTTLSTTSALEGASAGGDSVVLDVSGAWTASSNASWLHIATGGSGEGAVAFTFDANTGAQRSGTLTIAGLPLTVTQAAGGYVAANPLTTLVSSGLSFPRGLVVDGSGNVYFADSNHNAVEVYDPSTGAVSTLISIGLNNPYALAFDAAGNLYIADSGDNAIKEYNPSTQTLTTLFSVTGPIGVAVDTVGNVYVASNNRKVFEWNPSLQQLTTLVTLPGSAQAQSVAVDGAGNVYIAESPGNVVQEYNASTGQLSTVISGLNFPTSVSVDGSGNVYVADTSNNAIKERVASTGSVVTLASGLSVPEGVTTDALGNVYFADSGNNAIKEIPRAFVNTTSLIEGQAAGSDQLLTVLPGSEPLAGVFAPSSDQSWLTIGSISGGVIDFSFTANPGSSARTANITVLGQQITVTQKQSATLTPSSVIEGPAAGSDSVNLNITGPWTATVSSNSPWLHTSASGTNSGTVTFSFDLNMGAERTGTISVGGLTLTVTQATAPLISSPTDTSITATTATLGGNVTSDGGSPITTRGILYAVTSANGNPQLGGANVVEVDVSGTTGTFTTNITGLAPSTECSFVAFATNAIGTTYTSVGTFTTLV
jgi:DNA-binding beta-propeller fold protein YncE